MKDFSEDIVTFLNEHPLISVNALEKDAKMPKNSLTQAMTGQRKISFKYVFGIFGIIQNYGFKDYGEAKIKEVWDDLKSNSKPIDKKKFLKELSEKREAKRK